MRKTVRTLLTGLALVGCLALPLQASAVTYEDSFTNCDYPKTFDLVVMRPLSLITLALGTVLFVPFGTLAVFTVPRDVPDVYDSFIGHPARFALGRPLGKCTEFETGI